MPFLRVYLQRPVINNENVVIWEANTYISCMILGSDIFLEKLKEQDKSHLLIFLLRSNAQTFNLRMHQSEAIKK